MTDDERPKWKLLKERRDGQWSLTKWEVTDADGNVRQGWFLQSGTEDGRGGIKYVAAKDLPSLKNRLRATIQEVRNERARSQQTNTQTEAIAERQDKPRESQAKTPIEERELWHTVVKVKGINDDGTAKLEVLKAATSPEPLALRATGKFVPYSFHASRKPAEKDTLDVRVGADQSEHINHAVDQFKRGEERGRFHSFGVWTDATSTPVERQTLVKFTVGINHGGDYEDREVTPIKGQRPDQELGRLYVVFEKSLTDPTVGRVVGFSRDRAEAVGMVKALDRHRLAQQQTQEREQVAQQQEMFKQSRLPGLHQSP